MKETLLFDNYFQLNSYATTSHALCIKPITSIGSILWTRP